MKKHITKETLFTSPNFNKTFEMHTDARISQEGSPVAFYSRKLNLAQNWNYYPLWKHLRKVFN
jgi:hypothetical protein